MKHISKYFLFTAGLALLFLLAFSYHRITKERAVLLDDLDRRARVIAQSLSPASIRLLVKPPAADEEDLAERLSGQGRTLGILLCGKDGKMIARSIGLSEILNCEEAEIQKTLSEGEEKMLFGDEQGLALHSFIRPLKDRSGDLLGTLTVVHEASYINERVRSLMTWTTLTVAVLALFISTVTYFLSRRSFQRSIDSLLGWMKAGRESENLQPPTESLLKPVTREVEKLTARLRAARETAREVSETRQVSDLWTPARLKAHAVTHFGERPLIVVSNREPYMHIKELGRHKVIIPASGLITSLDPVLRATSGLWIAHGAGDADRETADKDGKILVPPDAPCYTLKRVWLTREEEEHYYYGFSNEALWPLCLMTHHRPKFEERDWEAYVKVNRKFADAVARECGSERPVILIQDYHFTLLPQFIREKRPDAIIGLFWHIPWPTLEVFQVCPWKREILTGMTGADFVGFHLPSHCTNFLDTLNGLLRVRVDWDRLSVVHDRGQTAVKPLPISIQPWSERGVLPDDELEGKWKEWKIDLDLKDQRLLVSVDRLDYAKGIPERVGAIDRFLEKHPQYRGKVRFVQLIAPSRMHIPAYRELLTEIEKLVDEVNWKHGTDDWKPVIHLDAQHTPQTVYTFLRMADIGIVSSLSDGMNLVAKEFVAAREEGDGVLILSEFAGVAREFQEALQVNPYARADFAEAIRLALEMPLDEQRRRMSRLKSQVAEHNVYRWAADLITEMTRQAETLHQKTNSTLSQTA